MRRAVRGPSARGTLTGDLAAPDLDVHIQLEAFPIVALDTLWSFNGYLEAAFGTTAAGTIDGTELFTDAWTSCADTTTPRVA